MEINKESRKRLNERTELYSNRNFAMKSIERKRAMKIIATFLFSLLIILAASCTQIESQVKDNELNITGSGNLVSREIAFTEIDQVEANLYFDLTIRQGNDPRVILTSDDNFIEYIQVEETESGISLGFKPGQAYDISGVTLQAEVILPELSRLDLNGSSHAHLDEYQSQQPFEANLSSASSLTGEVQLAEAKLNANGSSYIKLSGEGENLSLEACGSSMVDLGEYAVEEASLEVSCNSTVSVDVAGRLEVDASQHAQVRFGGQPAVKAFAVHEYASVQPK